MVHEIIERVEQGLQKVAPNLEGWVTNQLAEHGPWSNKATPREQLNCLLRYHLNGQCVDTSDVRGYLTSHDEDDVWVNTVIEKVIPVVGKVCV